MSKTYFPQALHDFRKSNNAENTVFNTVGPSLTRQEFAEECDINVLMARYDNAVYGGPNNLPPPPDAMHYVDWTTQPSTLLEYMDMMREAERAFMALPAAVRKEFDNDPVQFCDFASDPENLPQMRTWGLAAPEKVKDGPLEVRVVPEAPKAEPPPAPVEGASTHGST